LNHYFLHSLRANAADARAQRVVMLEWYDGHIGNLALVLGPMW